MAWDAPHLSALQLSDPFREPLTTASAVLTLPVTVPVPSVPSVPSVAAPVTVVTAGRQCPGCGSVPVANSVYCARCGHHLSETSQDGVKIRSLEAEIESLRALHLEEVGLWDEFGLFDLFGVWGTKMHTAVSQQRICVDDTR